jgi:outer membrane protein
MNLNAFFSVAAIAVLLFFASCTEKAKQGDNAATATAAGSTGLKIAYVNIDSLEAHYELLKTRREEFKKRQEVMEGELQQSYQQMQAKGEEMQRRAQTMSQSDLQQAEKQLMLMQQSLESRKQSLTDQLVKDQEEFNRDLKKRLDSFLENYN